jgi:two-component system phosphate regulon sensor histidine kinase PhoR
VRRLLLVNALIFAVLAAAVALARYGYIYATTDASRDREERLMRDLAEEKVLNIEAIILRDDQKLLGAQLPLDTLIAKLQEIASSLHVVSVFVLDDQLKVIPGGYVSQRADKEGVAFREWFEKVVLPDLPLAKRALNVRGHMHQIWDGKGYLFSFVRRVWGDKTYFIVIEEDLSYFVAFQFPQYFPTLDDRSKRIYQVVDSSGAVIYGLLFKPEEGALMIEEPFVETMDLWSVRVSERDESFRKELQRRRLVDTLFIGGAVTVLLAGLLVLVLAIRRERRANELKSEFISNVSHELKTPLSIITMFGEMLANGRTKGPEQANEYADIIWRESQRLGRLIDNVLDFAKIERGKGIYEFADSDVGEVVERAVDLVGRRLATAEMSIHVEIEPDLPHVKLDGNAFTLAVMNLIDNATKYAADGKKIELKLQRQGERIVLSVRDWGPGIDPDEQEQIFERFYRARAVRLKPIRGSGIGLALVRHIARAHHGDVIVESAPGKGSTFRLWLPVPD